MNGRRRAAQMAVKQDLSDTEPRRKPDLSIDIRVRAALRESPTAGGATRSAIGGAAPHGPG